MEIRQLPPHPVHNLIARLAAPRPDAVVVDLGCGYGATLAAISAYEPGATLLGLDLDHAKLSQAGHVSRVRLVRADLSAPLPLANAIADVVLSHNVLELLPNPVDLMADARRILRPHGRAVWSHTDFAALVLQGADPHLTSQILHAYASLQQPWMSNIDPSLANRLPDLVDAAGYRPERNETHTYSASRLEGHAARRVEEIAGVTRGHIRRGQLNLRPSTADQWLAELVRADQAGAFYFTESARLCIGRVP